VIEIAARDAPAEQRPKILKASGGLDRLIAFKDRVDNAINFAAMHLCQDDIADEWRYVLGEATLDRLRASEVIRKPFLKSRSS
jgi:hypothetical protein